MIFLVLGIFCSLFGIWCDEPFEFDEPVVTVTHYEWESYGTKIIFTSQIQGIIGEIDYKEYGNGNEFKITFASGNQYHVDNINIKLQAGDIITVDENEVQRTPCAIDFIELSNGTAYVNDRNTNYVEQDKLKLLSDDEMMNILSTIVLEDYLWAKRGHSLVPYDRHSTCNNYIDYEFVSLDTKLTESVKKND